MCPQAAASEDGEEDTCRSREHACGPLQGERGKWTHPLHTTSNWNHNQLASNMPRCLSPLPTDPNADAKPDVWRAVRGAGLQRGAGLTHPHPGEARGGAEGGLQKPDAAPVQHTVHAELLHPPPAQGEGGEDRNCQCECRKVEAGWGKCRINKCFSDAPGGAVSL